MRVLGIDPGKTGANALISQEIVVFDMPIAGEGKKAKISGAQLADLYREWRPDYAVIERVHAMPKQGVSSSFSFGESFGIIQGVCGALQIPCIFVTPATWKRGFGLDANKEMARLRAIELFPSVSHELTRKKDSDRAEALLIAEWGRRQIRPAANDN